ncbi:bifunctional [glutamate--ammonia ligase]-adenylyl-L-tyrosine phosphorylase/[glutamate--ammonia-ligase] adenylyltransferase [Polynucleobacter kasalickyi]|uniref:Bifunctional glutamine synthetase adenylyltransferase/adenylyl-removing enzyme n=1 Tax=Polynucleobacter kasalickyi TaxID=1938817 RepID=A0A1W1YI91_9BURK|nr:bifunctional [glutamate--ammonia ligase]-adenylyl-L-tyrosine phosphorylase/[glutamate--ammonia-ligase] adenylyltransferase [Polynucleobacter kasalickyi]SMC35863.1 glutamate-ammonia-ligase adenylyltransferase [Polynucleobacter kasalickyi]
MSKPIQISKEFSPYVLRWLNANPSWEQWLEDRIDEPLEHSQLASIFEQELPQKTWLEFDEPNFLARIRMARQKAMLWLGIRDIANLAQLPEVMQAVTEIAHLALRYASLYAQNALFVQYGLPQNQYAQPIPLWIIGMGKLGAKELNVSSDIDLIFVYECDGITIGGKKSISNHEWFELQGKKIIRYLTELTPQGFVFRVDMRLRPNGDAGPLVSSLEMLEEYFLVQGREWERYAWIKARLVYPLNAADQSGFPANLHAVVSRFVYRKYLDFGIIDSIRRLHRQIRHEANLRAHQYPERAFDIKLGKGGIREIEFLAQMFQLIRGGQEIILRTRSTVEVIQHIERLQLIPSKMAQDLLTAYHFLRKLEHLLQWRNDAQVHHLPNDDEVITQIASRLGFANKVQFEKALTDHQAKVAYYFSEAFTLESQEDNSQLSPSGSFEQYPEFQQKVEQVKSSNRFALVSEMSKQNFDFILLYVLDNHPEIREETLLKLLDFLEVIFRRSSYLSLLKEYPKAIDQVLRLLEASTWASQYLMKHPHLLDDLLLISTEKTSEQDIETYWVDWQKDLEHKIDFILQDDQDEEAVWNTLRQAHQSELFQILLADLGGFSTYQLPLEKVSDQLSKLADIIITVTLNFVWNGLKKKYQIQDSLNQFGFGVIAYGKLGGKELGYGSDLDLVFIYDESCTPLSSDDLQPIFVTLVRKFIFAITTATRTGVLYDIDTRLRPNGEAGLLVTSLKAFENYQKNVGANTAWVWEHQALTRARFCAGDMRVGAQFEKIRNEVLSIARDGKELAQEVTVMREKLHFGHPSASETFDLKHAAGTMIDIEFMIQYLILKNAHQFPALLQNIGNIALLQECANCQLITNEEALKVANAYRLFRKLQHQIRLEGNQIGKLEEHSQGGQIEEARRSVINLWQRLLSNI